MANHADFFVLNNLKKNIEVVRIEPHVHSKSRRSRNSLKATISSGNEKRVPMLSTEVTLEISLPEEYNMVNVPITIRSDVDVSINFSVNKACWSVKIVDNSSPPIVLTSVNITIGNDG